MNASDFVSLRQLKKKMTIVKHIALVCVAASVFDGRGLFV